MKNMYFLAALTMCLGSFSLQADTAPASCAASAAEQSFMDQLSDMNKQAFCGMSAADRASCMQMAQAMDNYGNQMTPDQAVESMSSTGSCGG